MLHAAGAVLPCAVFLGGNRVQAVSYSQEMGQGRGRDWGAVTGKEATTGVWVRKRQRPWGEEEG